MVRVVLNFGPYIEMTRMKPGPANANSPATPEDGARPRGTPAATSPDVDTTTAPEDATVQDWIEAEHSRPTLPDETADGLDDTDEEIRRQAEDLPDT